MNTANRTLTTCSPHSLLRHATLFAVIFVTAAASQGQTSTTTTTTTTTSAAAPDEPVQLQETIVTANRTDTAIDKIPGAITLVTDQQMSDQLLISGGDPSQTLAWTIPGYSPSTEKMNQLGESLRGRQALYLFDGIPQTTPLREGTREDDYFADMDIIDHIEVISGPSATEGLGAAGGIINYISKAPTQNGNFEEMDFQATTQFESSNLSYKGGLLFEHKDDVWDLVAYVGYQENAMDYDAHGVLVGLDDVRGDLMDTHGDDFFIKLGHNFGPKGDQRIQFDLNQYNLDGNNDFHEVNGNRALGIPTTSARGPFVGEPEDNQVTSWTLDYHNFNLAGGDLTAQLYNQQFNSVFGAAIATAQQAPGLLPLGSFYDQSDIIDRKWGVQTAWVHPDFLISGLKPTLGLDWLTDWTIQTLILSGRNWMPPTTLDSWAPFAQLEYDWGPLTLQGGVRLEDEKLSVPTFTTLYGYGSTVVTGGSQTNDHAIENLGAVVKLPENFSTYVSYSQGFSLPDVGGILRSVTTKNLSVNNLVSLDPVITYNYEMGLNWRVPTAQAGIAAYYSGSALGSSVLVNPQGVGTDQRVPIIVRGLDFNASWDFLADWKVDFIASAIKGKTAAAQGQPIDIDQSSRYQGPNKLAGGITWKYSKDGNIRFQGMRAFPRNINQGVVYKGSNLQENFNGYTVFDLVSSYKTRRFGTWSIGVENLFNVFYFDYFTASAAGFQQNTDYFAARGRLYSISDKITF